MALQYVLNLFGSWSSEFFRNSLVFGSQCSPSLTWDECRGYSMSLLQAYKWFSCSSHAKAVSCAWQQGCAGKQAVGLFKPRTMGLIENDLPGFQSSLVHPAKLHGGPLGNRRVPCHVLLVNCPTVPWTFHPLWIANQVFGMYILSNGRYDSVVHSVRKTVHYFSKL